MHYPGNFRLNFKPLKVKIEALIHWLNAKKKIILQTLLKSARHNVLLTVRNQLITNNQSQHMKHYFLIIVAEFTTG